MKQLLFVLLLAFSMSAQSQSLLGSNYSSVLKNLRSDDDLKEVHEQVTATGAKFITAESKDGEMFKWFFRNDTVFQYSILVDPENVNAYITVLNRRFVHDEAYQWSDYSQGYRIYWHVYKEGAFYFVTATLFDIKL